MQTITNNTLPETGEIFFTPVEDRSVIYRVDCRAPDWRDADDRRRKSARAYVDTNEAFEDANAAEVLAPIVKLVGAPHAWTRRGEFPALDRAWDAFNGEIIREEQKALATVEATLFGAGAFGESKFSKTAGCTCGCSPGFVLKGVRGTLFIEERRIAP